MTDMQPTENSTLDFEHYYMNHVQLLANIIDPNMLYAEWARATVWQTICRASCRFWYTKPTLP